MLTCFTVRAYTILITNTGFLPKRVVTTSMAITGVHPRTLYDQNKHVYHKLYMGITVLHRYRIDII